MLFNICITIILLWCKYVQMNAQCTIQGCDAKDIFSVQDIADEILHLRNRMDIHDQILINQIQRQAQIIRNQTSQLQNHLDNQSQSLQLQFQDLVSQIERQAICGVVSSVLDCSDIRTSTEKTTNGVYRVCVRHQQQLYSAKVFCNMTSDNETSWLVFQRRKDGSVDFYRTWSEYETGFGDPNGEFWLGNEMLHLLTSKRNYKLRVELEDFEGNRRYADYARFSIGSKNEKYRLHISRQLEQGDAGDSLSSQNGMVFSTKDADDEKNNATCAKRYYGAWWYDRCTKSNLNGKYRHSNNSGPASQTEGIFWADWLGRSYSLKKTEMKIAPV